MNANLNLIYNDIMNSIIKPEYYDFLYNISIGMYNQIINNNTVDINDIYMILDIGNVIYTFLPQTPNPITDEVYDALVLYYNDNTKIDNRQIGTKIPNNIDNLDYHVFDDKVVNYNYIENNKLTSPIKIIDPLEQSMLYGMYIDCEKYSNNLRCPIIPRYVRTDNSRFGIKDTNHKYPELVGTLDKVQYVMEEDNYNSGKSSITKSLEKHFFADHISKGIITPDEIFGVIVELKYDGLSVEAECSDMILNARGRGDTNNNIAVDYSHILNYYTFPNANNINDVLGIKFEAIMTYEQLYHYNRLYRPNNPYVSPRSAISGIMSNMDNNPINIRDYITLIPLDMDDASKKKYTLNKLSDIYFLSELYSTKGMKPPYMIFEGNYISILYQIRELYNQISDTRHLYPYAIDGIVVSYINRDKCNKLGRSNSVNKYSIAIKFNPTTQEATFLGYTYTVGKTGNITPMINYTPVYFNGGRHTLSTAYSYARFKELNLATGDKLIVSYNNDVMPYINKLHCDYNNKREVLPRDEFIKVCPSCGKELEIVSDNMIQCTNRECPNIVINKLHYSIKALGIKNIAIESIKVLYDEMGIRTLADLLNVVFNETLANSVKVLLGLNGAKFMDDLISLLSKPLDEYIWINALAMNNIGELKAKKISSQYTIWSLMAAVFNNTEDEFIDIINIPGFSEVSKRSLYKELWYSFKDMDFIIEHFTTTVTLSSDKKTEFNVVFSGIRDKDIEKLVLDKLNMSTKNSVSKKTKYVIVPYNGFSSGKTNDAEKLGVDIITMPELIDIINNSK